MADLGVLRTAKTAMAEDLIDQSDYGFIKQAFMRAQQIKAGMDAGFLREEDYIAARDAFLKSLDFKVSAGPTPPTAAAPLPTTHAALPSASKSVPQPHRPAAPPPPRPPPPPPPMAAGGHAAPLPPPPRPAAPAAVPCAGSESGAASSYQQLAEVAALPMIGRKGIVNGKKSMSGISINEHCINVFNHMKTRSAFKWAVFKIDAGGSEVVTEAVGSASTSYSDFTACMQPAECRYGVYDYTATNPESGAVVTKLVFVNWAPDSSSTRTKMMYASTKDFFKGFLDGVSAELQASDACDIDESEMVARVVHKI